MEVEATFSCQMANCTMSFDDEEQLTAHKKKHELSLTLTPTSYKNPFILDQTPTPTHFINPVTFELEEFEGHNDNPFEATFRRANSSNTSNNILMPESSAFIASLPDSEVLNTPSIILPSEPATPISLKPCILKNIKKKPDNQLAPFIINEPTDKSTLQQQSIEDAELPSESANLSAVESSNCDGLGEKKNENKKKSLTSQNVLQTSVITSVGNTTILKSNSIGVPTAVVVTRAPVNSVPTVSMTQVVGSQVAGQPVSQLKVQKTIQTIAQPLHLGAVLLSFNVEPQAILQVGSSNLPSAVAKIAPQVTSSTSNAKMKLKEVLTQNQKGGASIRKATASKSKPKPAILIHPDSSDGGRMSSPPSSPPSTHKPGHNGRRRGEIVDNPDAKRKKSLERNRAAATRCREKRKMWIKNLEKKADELADTNVQLQNEVNLLRNEVAHLKMLLLEHKDCPVTLQQRAHQTEKETYTTVRIITSASDDVQRVPNISVISPPSSDFLEMEVSSVQSSSDSLASEASETSYRER